MHWIHLLWLTTLFLPSPVLSAGGDSPQEIASPAGPSTAQPRLTQHHGAPFVLSWLESPEQGRHRLLFATWKGDRWSDPKAVAEGDDWFVNWADFPSVVARSEREFAAHWLARTGSGSYAYGVRVSFSVDGGESWTPSVSPYDDQSETEHGFVSIVPTDAGYALTWLDGRHTAAGHSGHGGAMTLRHTSADANGTLAPDVELDSSVCDCCQTSMVRVGDSLLVAYRDRDGQEIRDISVVRKGSTGWSSPRPLSADGWRIPGCPVNGPALATAGSTVLAVWYTQAEKIPQVRAAWSRDGGLTFGNPVRIDSGNPLGRVDAVLGESGQGWVSWLEYESDEEARILVRNLTDGASPGTVIEVARTSPERASGFPQMALTPEGLFFAWTSGHRSAQQVRTARLAVK